MKLEEVRLSRFEEIRAVARTIYKVYPVVRLSIALSFLTIGGFLGYRFNIAGTSIHHYPICSTVLGMMGAVVTLLFVLVIFPMIGEEIASHFKHRFMAHLKQERLLVAEDAIKNVHNLLLK